MKVVYVYRGGNDLGKNPPVRLKNLIGKNFTAYHKVLEQLLDDDTVILEVPGRGYKSVGKEDGEGWIQRNFSPEY